MRKVGIPRVRDTSIGKPRQVHPKDNRKKITLIKGRPPTVGNVLKSKVLGNRTTAVTGKPTVMGKRLGPATPSRTPVAKAPVRKAPPRPSTDFKRQGSRLSRLARR